MVGEKKSARYVGMFEPRLWITWPAAGHTSPAGHTNPLSTSTGSWSSAARSAIRSPRSSAGNGELVARHLLEGVEVGRRPNRRELMGVQAWPVASVAAHSGRVLTQGGILQRQTCPQHQRGPHEGEESR